MSCSLHTGKFHHMALHYGFFSVLYLQKEKEMFQNWQQRWLEIVSSTYILMGRYNHSLSLDATNMVSKTCPTIGEHVVIVFDTIGYHSNSTDLLGIDITEEWS